MVLYKYSPTFACMYSFSVTEMVQAVRLFIHTPVVSPDFICHNYRWQQELWSQWWLISASSRGSHVMLIGSSQHMWVANRATCTSTKSSPLVLLATLESPGWKELSQEIESFYGVSVLHHCPYPSEAMNTLFPENQCKYRLLQSGMYAISAS